MKTYLSLFMLALGLSYGLTPLMAHLAARWGVLDRPDRPQKIHERPTPRLGGIALYASFLLALAALLALENRVAAYFTAHLLWVAKLLVPSTLILLLGVYDDLRGANAQLKFSVQALAALLLYAFGVQITRIWNPLGGTIELGLLSLPLTLLWLIGITNAFNLLDGVDGLSAGAALFATLTLLAAALFYDQPLIVILTVALAGSIVGFLRYNFAPASIFLGDSGSLFLGFLLGALAIEGSQKSATAVAVAIPLVSFGLPILDTAWALMRRALGKRPLFQGDLEHIHHMLLRRGLTRRQVVILLYAVCAGFGLFSLLFLNPQGKPVGVILFILGVSVVFAIQSLGYPEFQELLHTLGEAARHHRTLARNIQLRRLIAELRQVESASELRIRLDRLLDLSGFDSLEIRWASSPERRWFFAASRPQRADAALPRWSLHLPLTDERGERWGEVILTGVLTERGALPWHHLCRSLQQELARALHRTSSPEAPVAHVPR